MVRINLVPPSELMDQHLIAEWNEILMEEGYVKKHVATNLWKLKQIPKNFCLGSGHIKFFSNKLRYLRERQILIQKEMKKRGYKPDETKLIDYKKYPIELQNSFVPNEKDIAIIRQRLNAKIKAKPNYYTYYGKKQRNTGLN